MKLIAFDLDGTLCPVGCSVLEKDTLTLRELAKRSDVKIALCSGKPTYYLCGFSRQLGTKDAVLIGENGATVVFGVDLPPKTYFHLPLADGVEKKLKKIYEIITENLDDEVWPQPNELAVAIFPKTKGAFDKIEKIIEDNPALFDGIDIYRHFDCYDFSPKGISKFDGLKAVADYLHLTADDVIAVGDGPNDYPMFAYAGTSIGVNYPDSSKVDFNFPTLAVALEKINEILN